MSSCSARGFTLVELVIALALMGMATLLLYGALDRGSRAWEKGSAVAERSATMILTWRHLGELLATASNPHVAPPGDDDGLFLFSGDHEGLEWVAAFSGENAAGRYIVRIAPEPGADGQSRLRLQRWLFHPEVLSGTAEVPRWRPYGADKPQQVSISETNGWTGFWYAESVLVTHLRHIEIQYRDGSTEGQWSGSWRNRREMPSLVRIRISDEAGSWPTMIFELPAS
jgi:general secretion pathway protein J